MTERNIRNVDTAVLQADLEIAREQPEANEWYIKRFGIRADHAG